MPQLGSAVISMQRGKKIIHPCPILSTRFYRKKTEVLFDRFVLFGEQRNLWTIRQVEFSICHLHLISDTQKYFTIFWNQGGSLSFLSICSIWRQRIFGTIRQVEFSINHLHLISDTYNISRFSGTRPVEPYLFDRFVFFGEQRIFYPTIHLISESDVLQVCRFVDSFYSANIILFGKYYARSDILCSPSENCTSLMTMTLTSLLIRSIRSIRLTDIHLVTSSFHPTIASYYSDGHRLHFRRNKHVCSENKHGGQTQGNVQIDITPRSLSVSHIRLV